MGDVDEAGPVAGLGRFAVRVLGVFGFGQGRNAQIFQIIASVVVTTGAVLVAYREWPDADDYVLVVGFTGLGLVALAYLHRVLAELTRGTISNYGPMPLKLLAPWRRRGRSSSLDQA